MTDTFPLSRYFAVVDDVSPEDVAMMQALYSRSIESSQQHLEKIKQIGSGKFMSAHYVGYGHKSIADCGSTTIFNENVSLLAAKAIQDWPLYCGQETSTRYIDMSTRDIVDPVKSDKSKAILDRWMSFYAKNQARVLDTIKFRHPRQENEGLVQYQRAAQARVFDVMRGFLPAGITTQLSWHTNLRQAGDHLSGMKYHPSQEISSLAEALLSLLHEKYPSSGFASDIAAVSGVGTKDTGKEERVAWEKRMAEKYAYQPPMFPQRCDTEAQKEAVLMTVSGAIIDEVHNYLDDINARPRGCVLPHFMSDFGQLSWSFYLDFGSFRDIQRHRNGVCRMPLLTTDHGFESWYLEQLDDDLRDEANALLQEQEACIEDLTEDPVVRQYYTALGYRVRTDVTYCLPAAIYVMELRSGKAIHPSLRKKIHKMIETFQRRIPHVKLHVDLDPSDWDIRRGSQTITAK
jgi:thymidylate synthase ThyX